MGFPTARLARLLFAAVLICSTVACTAQQPISTPGGGAAKTPSGSTSPATSAATPVTTPAPATHAAAPGGQITLRLATYATPGTGVIPDAIGYFTEEVAKRTNNQVKIQVFWGGVLGKENELFDLAVLC